MRNGCGFSSSRARSITITRCSAPTCGAARPMPGALYMVSSMSSMSRRTAASTFLTGSATRFSRGSGATMMGKTAIDFVLASYFTRSYSFRTFTYGFPALSSSNRRRVGGRTAMPEMPIILSALALLGVLAILIIQLRPKQMVQPDSRIDALSGQIQQLAAHQAGSQEAMDRRLSELGNRVADRLQQSA